MTARLVLAAPHSGSGKTLLAAGLIGALRRRGLAVQPFKCGPDYIDPGYHALAAGRPCRNLDTWMMPAERVRRLFVAAASGADIAVIEGVMGLFDGFGSGDQGGTADVARTLDAPVVLIVDVRGMARSAAALVAGFQFFDPRLRIGAVLLNRVGSARHADICASAIGEHTGLPCLGYLPRAAGLSLPERHLGLVTTGEDPALAAALDQAADLLAESCDLDGLLALARAAPALPMPPAEPAVARAPRTRPVIAVAQDRAFSFVYPELSELLADAGAIVAPFSPLDNEGLPAATSGVILSGGFPELYAERLSSNGGMHAALRQAHRRDLPIYAECGGLMYLTQAITDQQGRRWPMVGLLPGESRMTERVALGYRTVCGAADHGLLPAGATLRGHEFHYSRWEGRPDDLPPAYQVLPPAGQPYGEGARLGRLTASYIHLPWFAQPELAERFVDLCR
jgi:cobyrinic acid a,c-diamide synthase